jgi:hypothetical protein
MKGRKRKPKKQRYFRHLLDSLLAVFPFRPFLVLGDLHTSFGDYIPFVAHRNTSKSANYCPTTPPNPQFQLSIIVMIYSAATTMIMWWAEFAQITVCFTGNHHHQDKPKQHQDVAKSSKKHPPKSSSSRSTATTSTCASSLSSTMVSNSHRRRKTTREASTSRRSTSGRHRRPQDLPNQLVEPVSPYEEFPRTWKKSSRRRHHVAVVATPEDVAVVATPEDSPYDEAANTRIEQPDERQPTSYKRTVVDTPRTVPQEIYLGDDIPSHVHITEPDAVSEYSEAILPEHQDNRTLTPHPSFDEGADIRDFHYLYQASLELEQDWPSDEDGPGSCAFWSHGSVHERHVMNACDIKMVLRDLDDERENGSKYRSVFE